MIELVFPTAAALFIYFVAVPTLTLVCAVALRLRRAHATHAHEMGASSVWFMLIAPVLFPSLWLATAVAHQLDGHHEVVACLAPHDISIVCIDLILVAVFVIAPLTYRAWRQPGSGRRPNGLETATFEGIDFSLGNDVPGLVRTRGLFRPQIEVDADTWQTFDDEQRRSVLLHEAAHARGFDPFRKWVARVFLSVNPLAFMLKTELARWELGLEFRRDLEAVQRGGDRFRLAEALVLVARRGSSVRGGCCGLVEMDSLDLRVRVLCDDALPALDREYAMAFAALLVTATIAPHFGETALLDWLHHGAEASWILFAGG